MFHRSTCIPYTLHKLCSLVPNALDLLCVVQVEGTHPYTGEDTDELSFEAGDVINVIAFEDPEDQVRDQTTTRVLQGRFLGFWIQIFNSSGILDSTFKQSRVSGFKFQIWSDSGFKFHSHSPKPFRFLIFKFQINFLSFILQTGRNSRFKC